ncbi:MAG: hypothetical protein K6T71_08145 [Candidatus Bipolaricaulota bacterium]|nr:hypothetical protein [Candidatus Bipolaricaulota bacterium]
MRMNAFWTVSVVCVLVIGLFGCVPATIKEFSLDEPFTLFVRQKAQVAELQLQFLGVSQDSRCPVDVECVWAGNAKIALKVSLKDSTQETAITINSHAEPREAVYEGFRIEFVELRPVPRSDRPINPAEYRVTLKVSRVP